jgi:hypothetical protein
MGFDSNKLKHDMLRIPAPNFVHDIPLQMPHYVPSITKTVQQRCISVWRNVELTEVPIVINLDVRSNLPSGSNVASTMMIRIVVLK